MAFRDLALVALGGATGSMLRYSVGRTFGAASAGSSQWPWHTFAVNIVGAFAIGLLVVAAGRFGWPAWWRPLLAVGVLGGFTTFSAFSLETVEAALTGHAGLAAGYVVGSIAAGLAGCWLGVVVGRAL